MAEESFKYKGLIAVCGMNCGICDKYLAYRHQIPKKRGKVSHCSACRPNNKNCSFIKKKCVSGKIYDVDFCFECELFPCDILKKNSTKYKMRYKYDLIEALIQIQKTGLDIFIAKQDKIHKCERCGDTICIHNTLCYSCDIEEIIK